MEHILNITPATELILFVHTAKAIAKADAPADRVLLVAGTYKEGRVTRYVAWKCRLSDALYVTSRGGRRLTAKTLTAKTLMSMAVPDPAEDGLSAPTADFRKDSFYKLVTIEELKARMAAYGKVKVAA